LPQLHGLPETPEPQLHGLPETPEHLWICAVIKLTPPSLFQNFCENTDLDTTRSWMDAFDASEVHVGASPGTCFHSYHSGRKGKKHSTQVDLKTTFQQFSSLGFKILDGKVFNVPLNLSTHP